MENHSTPNENLQEKNSLSVKVKIATILYLSFPIVMCFLLIVQNPGKFLEFAPLYIFSILFFFWGPLLMIIGGFSYITRMSDISRIPSTSSVYDAITLPTIQYGPIKVILPVVEEEEIVGENED